MKKLPCILLLLALASKATAQSVPLLMNFQSRVTDTNGVAVGNTTPVNRDITLRIYDAPTAGNIIYAEHQISTIAGGDFSLLLGAGDPVGAEPKPALNSVFSVPTRYLGITVDDGTAAADVEITPRQQIVSTAFAFAAQTAQSVPAAYVMSTLGSSGLTTAGTRLGINAPDIASQPPAGTYRLTVRGDNTDPGQIANQIVVQSESNSGQRKLFLGCNNSGNYGSIQAYDEGGVGPNTLVLNPVGGNVGVGKIAPVAKLDVLSSAGPAAVFNGGNVGIGLTVPGRPLTVKGDDSQLQLMSAAGNSVMDFGIVGAVSRIQSNNGFGTLLLNPAGGNVAVGLEAPAGRLHVFSTGVTAIFDGGNVGIGTSAPGAKLEVYTTSGPAANFVGGNVGIGTTTPFYPLMVKGTAPQFSLENATGTNALNFGVEPAGGTGTGGAGYSSIQSYNGVNFRALSLNPLGGNVGIGTTTPNFNLEVIGNMNVQLGANAGVSASSAVGLQTVGGNHAQFRLIQSGVGEWRVFTDQNANLVLATGADGTTNKGYFTAASGAYVVVSDRRLKKEIEPITGVLDRVMQMQPVQYRYKDSADQSKRTLGFIAQEVEPLFPEVVNEGSNGYKAMSYSELIPVAIGAIKEVNTETQQLKEENTELKKQLGGLEERMNKLEALLEKQAAASQKAD